MNVCVLAAVTASASFLHEVNLSQTLSGSLGGTILRYHTGFGLFTCLLGLGAWAFDPLSRRFPPRRILAVAQPALVVLGLAGPEWIRFCDPLAHAVGWEFPLTVSCYLPLVLVGLISGLELPALMAAAPAPRRLRVLAADYVGMFAASVTYPLAALPALGVVGVGRAAALFNLLALVWIGLTPLATVEVESEGSAARPSAGGGAETPDTTETPLPRPLLGFLLLAFSFCSMAYELLTAKAIADFILDEVLAHCVTVGVFLIGLGLGTVAAERRAPARGALLTRELWLIGAATLTFPALTIIGLWWVTSMGVRETLRSTPWALLPMTPVPLLIGYFSGFELPLLLRCWGANRPLGAPLCLNYLGALLAGFAVPLVLLPALGPGPALTAVALLNLVLAGALGVRMPRARIWRPGLAAVGVSALLAHSIGWDKRLEQIFLRAHYFELRLTDLRPATLAQLAHVADATGAVRRLTSRYQTIDMVHRDTGDALFRQKAFTLYLNRQPQFSSDNWRTYHESLLYGAINLAGRPPRSVLILGGGDGLLAAQVLKLPDVREVTLVELDDRMIELARQEPQIVRLNEDAFANPRLRLVVGDAYRFVHRSPEHYDAVFIDFPYPNSFELSRLFSVEFYTAVRTRLNPGGFVAMDAPIWFDLDETQPELKPHEVLFNTLEAAGFPARLAFGPIEPFLFAMAEDRPLAFDYARLPAGLANRSFVNLTALDFLVQPYRRSRALINSVYHPRRFLN